MPSALPTLLCVLSGCFSRVDQDLLMIFWMPCHCHLHSRRYFCVLSGCFSHVDQDLLMIFWMPCHLHFRRYFCVLSGCFSHVDQDFLRTSLFWTRSLLWNPLWRAIEKRFFETNFCGVLNAVPQVRVLSVFPLWPIFWHGRHNLDRPRKRRRLWVFFLSWVLAGLVELEVVHMFPLHLRGKVHHLLA